MPFIAFSNTSNNYKKTSAGVDSRISKAMQYSSYVRGFKGGKLVQSYTTPTFGITEISNTESNNTKSFTIIVTTNSPAQITYTSSNTDITTMKGNVVTFKKPGVTRITVFLHPYVSGNPIGNYYPIKRYVDLVVLPKPVVVSFSNITTTIFTQTTINYTSSSTAPVTFTSSDKLSVKIKGNTLLPIEAGTFTITAYQPPEGLNDEITSTITLTVEESVIQYNSVNIFNYDIQYAGPVNQNNIENAILNTFATPGQFIFTSNEETGTVNVKLVINNADDYIIVEQF
jgi:hypothetical protein